MFLFTNEKPSLYCFVHSISSLYSLKETLWVIFMLLAKLKMVPLKLD